MFSNVANSFLFDGLVRARHGFFTSPEKDTPQYPGKDCDWRSSKPLARFGRRSRRCSCAPKKMRMRANCGRSEHAKS
eukprot:5185950-Pleurochrysis_carterae.AAC.1